VPTDGSPLSGKAVDEAVKLAATGGGTIVALHVVLPLPELPLAELEQPYEDSVDEGHIVPASLRKSLEEGVATHSRAVVDAVCAKAAAAGVKCEGVVMTGHAPHESIIEQAEHSGAEVIVMASHGKKGVGAVLLGSETSKVLVHSRIPVLVVR
jgi:nucleotide-binding universal stress UspA family protein